MSTATLIKGPAIEFLCDSGEVKSSADLVHTLANYQSKIATWHKKADGKPLKALLLDSCSFEFVTWLFALLNTGVEVVIPNNAQPETLVELAEACDFCCGEQTQQSGLPHVSSAMVQHVVAEVKEHFWPQTGTIYFSTSGSTGKSKLIKKPWTYIQAELDVLANIFSEFESAKILATVPHHHIYGLLFRLLLPMRLGAYIYPQRIYPEHIAAQLQSATNVVLISSPAFLHRLCQDNVLAAWKDRLSKVISSGGKLDVTTAMSIHQQLNLPVTEIYGSTESGGIGYRQCTNQQTAWKLFPRIKLVCDEATQQLTLHSPFIGDQFLPLEDTGQVNQDGTFILQGRVDRTVKIEEKRVNLSAIELMLLEHAWVEDCKVILLTGSRTILGAAIALSMEGREAQSNSSKHHMNIQLKRYLGQKFELVCIPRKWRFMTALPYNSQGKLPIQELEKEFD
ncbi:AMP-binding protein [Pseudoalteromonas rubra]|uniref:AMP-binding protein n=1 Tax=Pseudoalteromonas rubra TaxID=43658 RepID=UPI000F7B2067|nr:AMP-binding protein [Pseudoalteromonas rubra]